MGSCSKNMRLHHSIYFCWHIPILDCPVHMLALPNGSQHRQADLLWRRIHVLQVFNLIHNLLIIWNRQAVGSILQGRDVSHIRLANLMVVTRMPLHVTDVAIRIWLGKKAEGHWIVSGQVHLEAWAMSAKEFLPSWYRHRPWWIESCTRSIHVACRGFCNETSKRMSSNVNVMLWQDGTTLGKIAAGLLDSMLQMPPIKGKPNSDVLINSFQGACASERQNCDFEAAALWDVKPSLHSLGWMHCFANLIDDNPTLSVQRGI